MEDQARVEQELSTRNRARVLGLNYVDTSKIIDKHLYPEILPIADLKHLRLVPLQADQSNIHFGITTSTGQNVMNELQNRFQDQRLAFSIISDAGFHDYMMLYDPPKKIVYQDITVNSSDNEKLIEDVSATLEQVRADDMLAYLVSQAHRLNASDIHIESQADDVRIRLRIDGVLHPVARITKEKNHILLSAIASAGNISTSDDHAQQGHIYESVRMADGSQVDVNVRLETVPTINGMDVVMRLFNLDASMYTLDRLGLSEDERRIVDEIIAKPSGLVMVVGPTGSGKTTTLYSMLNSLNDEERKIITIEDPVEYQFPGISQIPVRSTEGGKDTSFADKLRAILRLDPDVVMIGEIRDNDTAKTALQAALTGHLVLSTFHAGNAAAALTRLADIIGQNPLFVSAIRLVMAQRLVRRLDDNLKQSYSPDDATLEQLRKIIDNLPEDTEKPNLDNLQLFHPGSSPENPYGYSGQMAVREQFLMTGPIRELLQRTNKIVTVEEIEEAAIKSGMRTMLQDGILKAIASETSLEEIYRVVG